MPHYSRDTVGLTAAVLAVVAWSAVGPKDRLTWWLEVAPTVIGLIALCAMRRSLRFTPMLQMFIALHMILLAVGAHYTYAEVPIGDWARDTFGLGRNHYDRLGHLAQGFVPALVAREVMLQRAIVPSRRWTAFFAVCVAMTISAVYELIEWIAAAIYGQNADAFLGGQGDIWDTQKDMACAFVGAVMALLLFARWQDRSLARAATRNRLSAAA